MAVKTYDHDSVLWALEKLDREGYLHYGGHDGAHYYVTTTLGWDLKMTLDEAHALVYGARTAIDAVTHKTVR